MFDPNTPESRWDQTVKDTKLWYNSQNIPNGPNRIGFSIINTGE